MQPRDFENWSTSCDTVRMPRRIRINGGMTIDEHTDDVDRAVFATVWNLTAQRAGIRASLKDEVLS